MILQPVTATLMFVVLIETLVVMFTWHRITDGWWRKFPAGRVLMALLTVQASILGLATISGFFPTFPGRPLIYIVLYTLLIGVVAWLGFTIVDEQRKNRNKKD